MGWDGWDDLGVDHGLAQLGPWNSLRSAGGLRVWVVGVGE
jgi:hypothetical protein